MTHLFDAELSISYNPLKQLSEWTDTITAVGNYNNTISFISK
jgi:hypothetical protein